MRTTNEKLSEIIVVATWLLFAMPATAIVADDVPPPNVLKEIREIQKELGGSALEGYSELWGPKAEPGRESTHDDSAWWADDGPNVTAAPGNAPRPGAKPPASARDAREQTQSYWYWDSDAKSQQAPAWEPPEARAVQVLRDAAAQLDVAANKLEQLDLYGQADALRAQAQRLRLDARGMNGGLQPTAAPTPAQQVQPTQQPVLKPTRPSVQPSAEGWPWEVDDNGQRIQRDETPTRPERWPWEVDDNGQAVQRRDKTPEAAADHSHEDNHAHEHGEAHEHGDAHERDELTPIPAPGEPLKENERLTPAPLRE
jgi:hypothetical protein